MIALDTNVISELARQVPDPVVLSWLDFLKSPAWSRPRSLPPSCGTAQRGFPTVTGSGSWPW